ncbi:MAG: hypothetical protein M3373_09345 [Gemmatimonadota bacterium]|nr:hypothetical protein [Gemmatimonadota bacterium]
MPRSLTIQRSVVTAAERDKFLERYRVRREHFQRAGCRYWLFEEIGLPGALIEFVEASDGETLQSALDGAPDRVLDQSRIYQELELE